MYMYLCYFSLHTCTCTKMSTYNVLLCYDIMHCISIILYMYNYIYFLRK